jgi:hypothetical protein
MAALASVGEHLLEPEAEQVGRVAAVGPRGHVPTVAGRAARPAVTAGATVDQPAPMARSFSMLPVPSPNIGPWPCARVNLRWKSCRPRRRGKRSAMMKAEEPGMVQSPRPARSRRPGTWRSRAGRVGRKRAVDEVRRRR